MFSITVSAHNAITQVFILHLCNWFSILGKSIVYFWNLFSISVSAHNTITLVSILHLCNGSPFWKYWFSIYFIDSSIGESVSAHKTVKQVLYFYLLSACGICSPFWEYWFLTFKLVLYEFWFSICVISSPFWEYSSSIFEICSPFQYQHTIHNTCVNSPFV